MNYIIRLIAFYKWSVYQIYYCYRTRLEIFVLKVPSKCHHIGLGLSWNRESVPAKNQDCQVVPSRPCGTSILHCCFADGSIVRILRCNEGLLPERLSGWSWNPRLESRFIHNFVYKLMFAASKTEKMFNVLSHNPSASMCKMDMSPFYRASICEGGLGSRNSVRLSVCLSACHTRALWQN